MVDPLLPASPSAPHFDNAMQSWVLSRYADVVAGFHHRHLNAPTPDSNTHARFRESTSARFASSRVPECPEWSRPRGAPVDLIRDVAEPWSLAFASAVTELPIEDARQLIPCARQVFEAAADPFNSALQQKGQRATTELARVFRGESGALDLQAFVALSQTLPCFLANSWLALLRHPSVMMDLRANPDRMPAAIEELLRYAGPAAAQFRTAAADVSIDGVSIHSGARVILMIASANRDAAQFNEPDVLDINRRGVRHLGFGSGAHACIGGALVRTAAISAMTAFVSRFFDAELIECAPRRQFAIRSLESLIVAT